MGDFFKLVHNENLKIYLRVRTWIMLGLLAVITAAIPMLISWFPIRSVCGMGLH